MTYSLRPPSWVVRHKSFREVFEDYVQSHTLGTEDYGYERLWWVVLTEGPIIEVRS